MATSPGINNRVAGKIHLLKTLKTGRVLVRCDSNSYRTPLFSYDGKGLYIRCKDCREQQDNGEIKRGAYHLIPWSQILLMMLGLAPVEEVHNFDHTGQTASDSDNTSEVATPNSVEGGVGDKGGQLAGVGVQLPSDQTGSK